MLEGPDPAGTTAPPPAPPQPRRAAWPRLRGWIVGTLLVGLAAAVGKGATDWAAGQVKQAVGAAASADTACLAGEWWHGQFGRPDPPDPERFRILIARLDRDPDGALSRKVVDAFRGATGIDWRDTCVAVSAGTSRADQEAGVATAEALHARRGADLVLWGEVVDPKLPAIRVWFTAERASPDLKARPWRFEAGELEEAFHAGFADRMHAIAASSVAPALDRPGQSVADILRPLLPRLRNLLDDPPRGMTPDGIISLRWTLALSCQTVGEQVGDGTLLHEAVALYRLALRDTPRQEKRDDWALTQNNLGVALTSRGVALRSLGARGDDEALREAVAAYRAALEEFMRERVPVRWAITQNNLGTALRLQAERARDCGLVAEALIAIDGAIEELGKRAAPHYLAIARETRDSILAAARGLGCA